MLVRDCRGKNPDRWIVGSQVWWTRTRTRTPLTERNRDGGRRREPRPDNLARKAAQSRRHDPVNPIARTTSRPPDQACIFFNLPLQNIVLYFLRCPLGGFRIQYSRTAHVLTTIFPRSRAQKLALFLLVHNPYISLFIAFL